MVISSFGAYLGHYAHYPHAKLKKYEPAVWRMKETQAMLSVLGKWGTTRGDASHFRMTDLDLRNLRIPRKAYFSEVLADRSSFEYADVEGVIFRGSSFDRVSFREANLKDADFRNAILRNCCFTRKETPSASWGWDGGKFDWDAKSKDADLEGADLCGANLEGAEITKQQYESAQTDEKTKPPGHFAT
jgi:hypothetical protein